MNVQGFSICFATVQSTGFSTTVTDQELLHISETRPLCVSMLSVPPTTCPAKPHAHVIGRGSPPRPTPAVLGGKEAFIGAGSNARTAGGSRAPRE